jgi:hypothetical protein
VSKNGGATVAAPSMATALARYYDALVEARIPEPLIHEIVLDAARRLHLGMPPEDLR